MMQSLKRLSALEVASRSFMKAISTSKSAPPDKPQQRAGALQPGLAPANHVEDELDLS
jgi:hypothetical protein